MSALFSEIRKGRIGVPLMAGCLLLASFSSAPADTVYMPMRQNLSISARPTTPLEAPKGITAIAGEVVDEKGVGLPGVRISEGSATTVSGADGKFVLPYAIPGKGVLQIDGRHVGRTNADYGFYQIAVSVERGVTNVLPFKNFLPLIDHSHDVSFPSPTTEPIVVTNPSLPGVELHIPAGVVLRDADGKKVTKLSFTAFPADKAPVPIPAVANKSTQFTIQPGAVCLYDAQGGIGTAQIVLPNVGHALPKARVGYFRYEPDAGGWGPYGYGSVSSDGTHIIPDKDTVLTDFASAECDPKTKSRPTPPARIAVLRSRRVP